LDENTSALHKADQVEPECLIDHSARILPSHRGRTNSNYYLHKQGPRRVKFLGEGWLQWLLIM
jgi:hypothetical protein